jgi:hypothetical protein
VFHGLLSRDPLALAEMEQPAAKGGAIGVAVCQMQSGFQAIRVVVNRSASARIQSMKVLVPSRSLARVGQTNQ